MVDENQDLLERYEDVLRENEILRREQGVKYDDAGHKWTPKANTRRAWEELDERESTRATTRDRSAGQRSGGSTGRNVRYSDGEESSEISSRQAPRKISDNSATARKSVSGHSVAFEQTEEVITVPATGSMRSSRSRVSTPFFSEETVSKMHQQKGSTPRAVDSSDDVNSDRHSSVNFEKEVHVVEVPLGENDGHHSRSVRGRIATPFIRDVPTREAEENAPETVPAQQ